MFVKSLQVGMIQTNCYLLGDEAARAGAVIDPGDEPKRILKEIQAAGLEIKMILLTHGHFDHVLGVSALAKALGDVPVYLCPRDRDEAMYSSVSPASMGEVKNLVDYDEGDTLTLGGLTIQVLATPGHTPGSVCLKVGDALFTGDTLFAGSCGRIDLPGGNEKEMLASLKRLDGLEGDYTVYPGHDRPSTLERERQGNYCIHMARQTG